MSNMQASKAVVDGEAGAVAGDNVVGHLGSIEAGELVQVHTYTYMYVYVCAYVLSL
jgi:hypothetical protein